MTARRKWTVKGDPTAEFRYLDQLSSRDAIIYVANKYKDDILKGLFKNRDGYHKVADDLGILNEDLYMFFTYRLGINSMVNPLPWHLSDDYLGRSSYLSKEQIEEHKKEREKLAKEKVFYNSNHLWELLAWYCKNHSYGKAKSALKEFQRLHEIQKKNGWTKVIKQRMRELFTPMFLSEDNYKMANILVCHVQKKEKAMVFKGELANYGQKETQTFKMDIHYAPECLVIPKVEEDAKEISKFLQEKKEVIVVGVRDNPKRNIINTVLEIKTK